MLLQARKCPRLPANHQKQNESMEQIPSQIPEGTNLADTLILDLRPSDLWDSEFLLLKPTRLWYLVTADTAYSLHAHGMCVLCAYPPSCLTLGDPMDCSLPGSSVHGVLQARMLDWAAIPFSRGSSQPRA